MTDQREFERLRLFISLPIPVPVKTEVVGVQNELRRKLPDKVVRWTKPEQFHLTLKFLGNVARERVADLSEAIRTVCIGTKPLQLRAERIGCFPSLRFPRVIWVWVHDAAGELLELQKRIKNSVGSFAETVGEKEFTGHVTLGRINRINRRDAQVLEKEAHALVERQFGDWTADEIKLMRSELGHAGATHTELATFRLGTG